MPRLTTIESGDRFGRLEVVCQETGRDSGGNKLWLCRCDCGNRITVNTTNLNSANTKSCGCLRELNGGLAARLSDAAVKDIRESRESQNTLRIRYGIGAKRIQAIKRGDRTND